MFEGLTCVYRSNIDLYFYVIGSSSENEVIVVQVQNKCFHQLGTSFLSKWMFLEWCIVALYCFLFF